MRRFLALLPLLAACSSSSSTYPSLDGGAAASVTPQGAASVEVVPGANGAARCPVSTPGNAWSIGGSGLAPVVDGADEAGDPVKVACSVVPTAAGAFSVTGDIELGGKGSLTIQGELPPAGSGTVSATVVLAGGLGRWTQSDCTYSFPSSGGVAAGRVWLRVECPGAADSDHGTTCDASAEVRLENCAQH